MPLVSTGVRRADEPFVSLPIIMALFLPILRYIVSDFTKGSFRQKFHSHRRSPDTIVLTYRS